MAAYVTVTGTLLTPEALGESGYVLFTLTSPLTDATGNTISTTSPVQATLDENGSFSVELLANDDPDLEPAGVVYLVREALSRSAPRSYYVTVPYTANGGELNLADLVPIEDVDPPVWSTTLTSLDARVDALESAPSGGGDHPDSDHSSLATSASVTAAVAAEASARSAADALALAKASNLSDLANAATARTNLGLGSAATSASTDFATPASVTSAVAAVAPTQHFIPGTQTAVVSSGYTDAAVVDASHWFGIKSESSGQVGNAKAWDLVFAAGTWTLDWYTLVHTDRGKVEFSLDGVSIGTLDAYSGSTARTVLRLSGITVATAGRKRLRIETIAKNPSSGGNWIVLNAIAMQRTA